MIIVYLDAYGTIALNLVNGMLLFTIKKSELLTSFWLFVPKRYISVYIEQTNDTTCFLINSDVTGTVEMDHRSVCFDVR